MSKKIVDIGEVRTARRKDERRKVERFFLREMVQFFCLLDGEPLALEMLEASESGCSFRVPLHSPLQSKMKPEGEGAQLSLRFYMSRETYLNVGVQVVSVMPMTEKGRSYMRYGCSINETFASYPAFLQFIKFIESYSELCRQDREKFSTG